MRLEGGQYHMSTLISYERKREFISLVCNIFSVHGTNHHEKTKEKHGVKHQYLSK